MKTFELVAGLLDVPVESTTTSVTVMLMIVPLVVLTPAKNPHVTGGFDSVGVAVVCVSVVGDVDAGITYDHL